MFDVRRLFAALRPRREPATAYERGLAALAAGRHDAAIASFDVAATEAETSAARARALNKRGVAAIAAARRDEALAAFCDALDADERCAPALVNVGNLLFEDGHVDDAIDYYRAASDADPRYALALRNLGIALKRSGRRGESVRALRSAARLEGSRGARS